MNRLIEGVKLSKNKIINAVDGSVLHGIKRTDKHFKGFGEAYFSTVNFNSIKGWKKHTKMNLNIVVPHGEILFVLFDGREKSPTFEMYNEFKLSIKNYVRLTIPPKIWVAFKGIGKKKNLLLNIADIEHDQNEIERCSLDKIRYEW
jgi:dTDP-4-dehydrorhamnose 3,5-epimerase